MARTYHSNRDLNPPRKNSRQTDNWYVKELVADIPIDEMQAAVEDEDFEMDDGESVCEEGGEEDDAYSEDSETTEGDGTDWVSSNEGSVDGESEVDSEASENGTADCE